MSGIDDFEKIGEHLFRCKICGKEVTSGVVNISGHWAECGGKSKMAFVNKVGKLNLAVKDKMDLIKNEFDITQ